MVAAYNGPQDQALKGSGKKKSDLMKLYFSKQQNTNTSGGTESMETLDSQSKAINGGAASANVGRSQDIATALRPQNLFQPDGGKNAYPNYNINILNEVSKQNQQQYSVLQPSGQSVAKNRSHRQHLQLHSKRNVMYHPQINNAGA